MVKSTTRRRGLRLLTSAALAAGLAVTAAPGALAGPGPTAPSATVDAGSAAAAGSAPTGAIPFGMSALTYHRMLAQIPLDDAATRIREAVSRPGAGHDGFIEVWVDADRNDLTVYWHGTVPPDIQRLLDSLGHSMHVHVVAARYSSAQLDQAVDRVVHGQFGVQVTGLVGPLPDGSGIQVGVSGSIPAVAGQQLFGTDVAVKVVPAQGGLRERWRCYWNPADALSPPARCNDLAPGFWGGAVINNFGPDISGSGQPGAVVSGCSTGFGVHSNTSSSTYVLTAGHCGAVWDWFENGNLTETLGLMTQKTATHDDAMVWTPDSSGNRYYDGPSIMAGDTHNTKIVAGQQPSAVGDWLCVSGAFGGVICNVRILALNQQGLENGSLVTRIALASNGSNVQDGDSGGPVFSLAAYGKVTAKGTLIGTALDPNTGGTDIAFMTIDWISSDFKVSVNTG